MRLVWSLFFIIMFNAKLVGAAEARKPAEAKSPKGPNIAKFIEQLKESESDVDPLSRRIIIKQIGKSKISYKVWNDIRIYLLKNPQIGYDLIYKWDKIVPTDHVENKAEDDLNDKLDQADSFILNEKYNAAFKLYQEVALEIKKEIKKGNKENAFLYNSAVHSMARALFSSQRYTEALEVYSWIPKDYPRFRQVLFEKMWASFRGGRLDITLGAIASQESAYFSNFIEPETFLVKIYAYKKMCFDEEVKAVRKEIETLKKRIDGNPKDYFADWAKSDIEMQSLYNLTKISPNADSRGEVKAVERKKEIDQITDIMQKKFEIDVKRIKKDLENIMAYSFIALGSKDFAFVKHQDIDREALLARGDEIWPAEDREEWIDEFGGHLFIGESACKAEKAQ